MKKALIAMSGGVDSSVAAAIAVDAGYDCIGATMKLFTGTRNDCGCDCHTHQTDDAQTAAEAAKRLGFEHVVLDFNRDFEREVISRFVCAYENALTPNPCIDCNRYIKFGALLDKANAMGCDYIVTGHYARIEKSDGRYILKKGMDADKDQSYVLYSLSQQQLSHTLLPLGQLTKDQVRDRAERLKLSNSQKPDSQDICFVPDGDYAGFITRYTGKTYPQGEFTDQNGQVLGTHGGIIKYTIGQRKGLGLSLGMPMYVKSKDIQSNRVILARDCELYSDCLTACDFNWIAYQNPGGPFSAQVKTRYKSVPADATVIPLDDGRVKIVFDRPQRAITRGQAAVVYQGDTVVGGGTIE